jgi:hypothetical protein
MSANRLRSLLLCLPLLGCTPNRNDLGPDPVLTPTGEDLASEADMRGPAPGPDLAYACGEYSAYQARTEGVVRSPCAYDVSKILSIGGDVKTKIRPPTITMEFPDGTTFAGQTDGKTFTATRTQNFPFEDGCTWRAVETLSGSINAADECRLRASYTYREAPIMGSSCATPCTIDAQVVISRTRVLIE